jgi:predicted GNAT family acetyltransferase
VNTEVRDQPGRSRYELLLDGEVIGYVDYLRQGGVWVFTHTEVSADHRSDGLASTLVRGALDDVRRRGNRVVPRCPYVGHFIDKHPEYADLVSD